ncbi:MAG: helix-turn-helix domain-containing protein [Propionibacteriaceae bacterium]|nr:helix-turn-helix domain-containing protein [Propionibacteriaceae bacterium]
MRDTKEPLTVDQIAKRVGLPPNTARFHLESLVDAGLATRETQTRSTPGRPKVAYMGTLPTQTHERAQGFRLLAEIMAATVAQSNGDAGEWMYKVGTEWGRFLTSRGDSSQPVDETKLLRRLMDKLDALWFAPEVVSEDPPVALMHNCPYLDSARRHIVMCQLHAGMINGSLEEMRSGYRLARLRPMLPGHKCEAEFAKSTARVLRVPTEGSTRQKPASAS